MRVYFVSSGPEKWRFSKVFLVCLANFVIGFAAAWLIWLQTAKYMLDVMQQ